MVDEEALLQQAETLLDLRRHDEAIKTIAMLMAAAPEEEYYHFLMARAMLDKDDWVQAKAFCMSGLKQNPDHAYGFFLLSISCHYLNEFDNELKYAQESTRLMPDEAFTLDRLARAQIQSGMLSAAKDTARQLVEVGPNSVEGHHLLADITFDLDDYNTAETHYRAALRLEPDSLFLQNNLGRTLLASKQWREAIDTFFTSTKLDPTNETVRSNLHLSVEKWLGRSLTRAARQQKLEMLPAPVQMFFADVESRRNLWSRTWFQVVFWIAVTLGVTIVIQLGSG